MKIRTKLTLTFATSFIVVFALLFTLLYFSSRKMMVREIRTGAVNKLNGEVAKLEGSIKLLECIAEGLGFAVSNLKPISEEDVKDLLKGLLKIKPDVYGSTVAFVPRTFLSSDEAVAPYIYRNQGKLDYKDLSDPSYNYYNWSWFTHPIETGKPEWSDPYVDKGGGDVAMLTYSQPFYLDDKPWGVATVDVSLSHITGFVNSIKVGKTGFAFLLSKNGTFLSMLDDKWELTRTIFDVAGEFDNSAEVEKLGKEMTAGNTGYISYFEPIRKQKTWVAYAPIKSTGWSLGIVIPENELLADLTDLNRRLIFLALIGIAFASVVTFIVANKIAHPITALSNAAEKISSGDIRYKFNVRSGHDEIGNLARSFVAMQDSIVAVLDDLRREKELMSSAFSHSTDALLLISSSGEILKSNIIAQKIFMSEKEHNLFSIIGKHFTSSTPVQSLANIRDTTVVKLTRPADDNNTALIFNAVLSPIFDGGDKFEWILFSARDITESESQDIAKRDFLALMSHKLFTPITAIQGKLMLFHDKLLGEVNEKQAKCVTDMISQSGKLHATIDALVNFVTVEGEQFDKSKEEIDLSEFLSDLSHELQEWHAEKNALVTTETQPQLFKFSFNKKYLRLILSQLIDNGLKYNMSDPAKVSVKVRREGEKVIFDVEDNGVGIPPEYHERIFEKFYQIDKYFTGNVEGVGLGLAYVRSLIEAFGGTITLTSTIGQGSKFTVTL